MRPETSNRHQKALLWVSTGTYDNYGNAVVEDPVEIEVRWEDLLLDTLSPLNNSIPIDAYAHVNQEVTVGSHMWKGSEEEWNATGQALADSRVMEVKWYKEIPDVKGRHVRRTVGLKRLRDK